MITSCCQNDLNTFLVEPRRIELLTSCLQSRRSPKLSYGPKFPQNIQNYIRKNLGACADSLIFLRKSAGPLSLFKTLPKKFGCLCRFLNFPRKSAGPHLFKIFPREI